MFTGIVEELGEVVSLQGLPDEAARLRIRGPKVTNGCAEGESIAVNGVCLTALDIHDDSFSADVMAETLRRSSLGELVAGSPVNLERPTKLDGRLGGHLVQGHVDGVGYVLSRHSTPNWDLITISLPGHLSRYVVEKGSIAVDGVSLTVVEVVGDPDDEEHWFTVSLIPTTLSQTTLGRKRDGEPVNLEVDVIAKHVERLMGWGAVP